MPVPPDRPSRFRPLAVGCAIALLAGVVAYLGWRATRTPPPRPTATPVPRVTPASPDRPNPPDPVDPPTPAELPNPPAPPVSSGLAAVTESAPAPIDWQAPVEALIERLEQDLVAVRQAGDTAGETALLREAMRVLVRRKALPAAASLVDGALALAEMPIAPATPEARRRRLELRLLAAEYQELRRNYAAMESAAHAVLEDLAQPGLPPGSVVDLRLRAWDLQGRALLQLQRPAEAVAAAQSLLDWRPEANAAWPPAWPEWRARALQTAGLAHLRLGDGPAGERFLRQARRSVLEWPEFLGREAAWRQFLTVNAHHLARLAAERQDWASAGPLLDELLPLLDGDPGDSGLEPAAIAEIHGWLASQALALSHPEEALRWLEAKRTQEETLLSRTFRRAPLQARLAETLDAMIAILAPSDPAQRLPGLLQARQDLLLALLETDWTNETALDRWRVGQVQLAEALRTPRDPSASVRHFQQAVEDIEARLRGPPAVPEAAPALAGLCLDATEWLARAGQEEASSAFFARADALLEALGSNPAIPAPLRLWAATLTARLGDFLLGRGDLRQAYLAYTRARLILEALSNLPESPPAWRSELARVYLQLGEIQIRRDRPEEAQPLLRLGLKLLPEEPPSDAADREVEVTRLGLLEKLAGLLASEGESEAAGAYFAQARALATALSERRAADASLALRRAALAAGEAEARRAGGDLAGARTGLSEERQLLHQAVRADPYPSDPQVRLLRNYAAAGEVELALGDGAAARRHFEAAGRLAESLALLPEGVPDLTAERFRLHRGLGECADLMGDRSAAIACFRQAAACRPGPETFPSLSGPERDTLVQLYLRIGELEEEIGQPAAAVAAYRLCFQLSKDVYRQPVPSTRRMRDPRTLAGQISALSADLGDFPAARLWAAEERTLLETYLRQQPRNLALLQELYRLNRKLSDLAARQGLVDEQTDYLEDALAELGNWADREPAATRWRVEQADTLQRLASLDWQARRLDQARTRARAAAAFWLALPDLPELPPEEALLAAPAAFALPEHPAAADWTAEEKRRLRSKVAAWAGQLRQRSDLSEAQRQTLSTLPPAPGQNP